MLLTDSVVSERFAIALITYSLICASACQDIPADNPYDPRAPKVTQAAGQILGELLTSEAEGDLRGASVYLLGRSGSSLVECLSESGETLSEDDGTCQRARFTLTDVPPGTYQLGLNQPCFGGEPFATVQVGIGESVNLSNQENEDSRRFILVRYARGVVSGSVQGPPTSRLSLVRVSDGRGAVASPNDEGEFRIEMAACRGQLRASLEGFRSASSTELDVPVGDELRLDDPLILQLEPIPAIVIGRLSSVEGELPEEGVTLTLSSASPESEGEEIVTQVIGEQIKLEELETGPWNLKISHPSFQTVERRIELEAATRGEVDAYRLGEIRLFPAIGSLRGQVTLSRPRSETPIFVELLDGPSAGLQLQVSSTGEFIFSSIRGGAYRIEARAEGFLNATSSSEALVLSDAITTLDPLLLELNPAAVRGVVRRPSTLSHVPLTISLGGEITQNQDDRPCVEGDDCLDGARCEGSGATRTCLQPMGYYEFNDLTSGDYRLEARALDNPRLRSETLPIVRAIAGETTTLPTIELERSMGEITGAVRLLGLSEDQTQSADGFAALRASILSEDDRIISLNVDPLSGEIPATELPVGTHLLMIAHSSFLSAALDVTIESDGSTLNFGTVELEINPAKVSGSVTDGSGQAISGASVLIGGTLTQTNAQGLFEMNGLMAGRVQLLISADGFRVRQLDDVILSAGEESVLSPINLDFATGSLSGMIALEGRSNASGALVRAEHLASGEERLTLSEASGAWRLDGLRVGEYLLSVSLSDYESESSTITVVEESNVDIDFTLHYDRGCFLGQLSLSDGADDFEEVNITLLETVATTQANSNGRFMFEDLIPGAYTIQASRDGYREAVSVTYVEPGASCEQVTTSLELKDLQAPNIPLFELAAGQVYEPIGSAASEPWVIARTWNAEGNISVALKLQVDDSNPYEDINFDPAQGQGEWWIRFNQSEPLVVPPFEEGEAQQFSYQQVNGSLFIYLSIPAFSGLSETLSQSSFVQRRLQRSEAELALLEKAEVVSLLEEAIGPPNSFERYGVLLSRGEIDLNLEISAMDEEGNRSESERLSLRLDFNPPALDPLNLPDECQERRDQGGRFRACETSRETLSLSLSGQSPDLVCAYLVELRKEQANAIDFSVFYDAPMSEVCEILGVCEISMVEDCLAPSAAQLISSHEEAEGESVYCLFGVDLAQNFAVSRSNRPEDFCISITRDITAPSLFRVYPDQVSVRGNRVPMRIEQELDDPSLAWYEFRNLTRGGEYIPVQMGEDGVFLSPYLKMGENNILQFRAVDFAGNVSEAVTVELKETSIQRISPSGGPSTGSSTVIGLSTYHDKTALLSPSECVVDGEGSEGAFGGRGCRAKLSLHERGGLSTHLPPHQMTYRVAHQPNFSFTPSTSRLAIRVNASGSLNHLSLSATFSSFNYIDTQPSIELIPPHSQPINLVDHIPLSSLFVPDGQGGLRIDIKSESIPSLQEALEGVDTYGEWTLKFMVRLEEVIVSNVDLIIITEGDELNRCIIACDDLSADIHTGGGVSDFQLKLSEKGLIYTQYTEQLQGSSHDVRFWWEGDDQILGSEDDLLILVDDDPEEISQPVIAIDATESFVAFARAGSTVDPDTGALLEPSFHLNAFGTSGLIIRHVALLPNGAPLEGSVSTSVMNTHHIESATLRSMTMVEENIWFIYTDHQEETPVDRLGLWIPNADRLTGYYEVTLSPPFTNARPISVSQSANRLLLYVEVDGEERVLQVPGIKALSDEISRGVEGDCDCNESSQICVAGFCKRLSNHGSNIEINCSEAPSGECDLCLEGEVISMTHDGEEAIFQLYQSERGDIYRLVQVNLDDCERGVAEVLISEDPFESIHLSDDRVTYIKQEQREIRAFEREMSTLEMGGEGSDATRENLQVGAEVFLERRSDGIDSSLFLTPKGLGKDSVQIQFDDPISFDGGNTSIEVEGDQSWNKGRGFLLIKNSNGDQLYLAVKDKASERRVILRAPIELSEESLLGEWTALGNFTGEVTDMSAVSKGTHVLLMFGSKGFNGPRFVFDIGESTGNPIWSYQSVGGQIVPNAPCLSVEAQRISARSYHDYLLGCVMQSEGGPAILHFAELDITSFLAVPTMSHLKTDADQYLNEKLAKYFGDQAPPSAYKVQSLGINSFGSILLELRDDEVGRLYMSNHNSEDKMFNLKGDQSGYSNFSQFYARLGADTSPPIFSADSVIFSDELITQEPEIIAFSIFEKLIQRLSSDESPQSSPAMYGGLLYWFDERYLDSAEDSLGIAITQYGRIE